MAVTQTMDAADQREAEARSAFIHDRSAEAREAWRKSRLYHQEAHRFYWTLTSEYLEVLAS
jgi:hypothetical protein